MRSFWLPVVGLVIWALALGFNSTIEKRPVSKLQSEPTWIGLHTDPLWHDFARWVILDTRRVRSEVFDLLLKEKEALQVDEDLMSPDDSELIMEGTYGKLPEVHVDQGHGAVFPAPVGRPNRFSWFQTVHAAIRTHRHFRSMRHTLSLPRSPGANVTAKKEILQHRKAFESQVNRWHALNAEYVAIIQKLRYLESWVPQLLQDLKKHQARASEPTSHLMVRAIFSPKSHPVKKNAEVLESLREILKPHRVMRRTFLPEKLTPGLIQLPVATDIQDPRFLREIEGALDTHWNQSPWAQKQKIQFKIRWKKIPENIFFAAGKQTLEQHLSHFPPQFAVMTTGALTTHVTQQALVFGLGKINARTLAHELGHLLGFSDCYMRTVTDQGAFGLGILEWDNPIYPDDIMCDNTLGVARVEVW